MINSMVFYKRKERRRRVERERKKKGPKNSVYDL